MGGERRGPKPSPYERDQRRYRHLSLPDDVAAILMRTCELGQMTGKIRSGGSQVITTIEACAITTYNEWLSEAMALHPDRVTEYDQARWEAFMRDGWRCQDCGHTSNGVTPHHIVALSAGGEKCDARNIISLCVSCHDAIQPEWTVHVPRFRKIVSENEARSVSIH